MNDKSLSTEVNYHSMNSNELKQQIVNEVLSNSEIMAEVVKLAHMINTEIGLSMNCVEGCSSNKLEYYMIANIYNEIGHDISSKLFNYTCIMGEVNPILFKNVVIT